eukprot:Nk52_evm15s2085 gene=Nk52_evmTU15s2085
MVARDREEYRGPERVVRVTVIGAGVVGLYTAYELLSYTQRGGGGVLFDVRVVAKKYSPDLVSDVAGGLWFPFKVQPEHKVERWGRATQRIYGKLLCLGEEAGEDIAVQKQRQRVEEEIGLHVLETRVYSTEEGGFSSEQVKVWGKYFEADRLEKLPEEELAQVRERGGLVTDGYVVNAICTMPTKHMAYLMREIQEMGGTFVQDTVHPETMGEKVFSQADIVINCTGMEARWLFGGDDQMYPIRGQVSKLRMLGERKEDGGEMVGKRTAAMVEQGDEVTYLFNRADLCVVGGTAYEGDWDCGVREEDTMGYLERCRALVGGELLSGEYELVQTCCGLRPARKGGVRLELEMVEAEMNTESSPAGERRRRKTVRKPVVHNYGHGGSGWTIGPGCAEEVRDIVCAYVKQMTKSKL